jgi:peptidoglycan L-alanyl-D-glutamate endopeptidase CwlK
MSYRLGLRSLERVSTVHPDLRRVIERAIEITPIDFAVLEGARSLERQRLLFTSGATRTMNSRHLPHPTDGLARAVDIAPMVAGKVRWDWPLFFPLARSVKDAAAAEGVPVEWGGDWKSFKDGPHWQLPWANYP